MVSESSWAADKLTDLQYRYQDYITAQGNTKSQAYVLAGGVNAWLQKFGSAEDLVDKDPVV